VRLEEKCHVIYGDEVFESSEAHLNRAFFFGESLFTSILLYKRNYFFLDDHFDRLKKSITFLYGRKYFSNVLEHEIREKLDDFLQNKVKETDEAYNIRIIFFMKSPLGLLREEKDLHYLIVCRKVDLTSSSHSTPLKLCTSFSRRALSLRPAFLKVGSYVDQIIELERARRKNFDDVIFLDTKDQLLEASTSNIFIRLGDRILTSPRSSSVLDGITRRELIYFLKDNGINVEIKNLPIKILKNVDRFWVTSSIRGVKPVSCVDNYSFKVDESNHPIDLLINQFKTQLLEVEERGVI
jgi:branched-subunit amino acid aminotransferase/4-amino-4-deoxychorismate lyase